MTAAADFGHVAGTAARTSVRTARADRAPADGVPVSRRRPSLALVATPRPQTPRAPFVAVVVSLLVAGLLGLLGLNTVLAQDAFTLHTLRQEGRALADQEQSLSREVEALRSPQSIAERAEAMDMVPGGSLAFLSLPDGRVSGSAVPALPPGTVPGPDGEPVPGAEADAGEPSGTADDTADDTTEDTTDETGTDAAATEDAATEDAAVDGEAEDGEDEAVTDEAVTDESATEQPADDATTEDGQ